MASTSAFDEKQSGYSRLACPAGPKAHWLQSAPSISLEASERRRRNLILAIRTPRILTDRFLEGGNQRPDERSILGEGLGGHQEEPAMDSP